MIDALKEKGLVSQGLSRKEAGWPYWVPVLGHMKPEKCFFRPSILMYSAKKQCFT
jgi:hypothetical protein